MGYVGGGGRWGGVRRRREVACGTLEEERGVVGYVGGGGRWVGSNLRSGSDLLVTLSLWSPRGAVERVSSPSFGRAETMM